MLNKVPEVTLYFWILKILCTTVGETAADYLNTKLHFGLTNTTCIMAVLLLIALVFQFRASKYIPWAYWLAVVLISVVGTLITDNLTDHFRVPLLASTILFTAALIAAFTIWYASEKTLSIHSIVTTRREAFYWLAILCTFALGTAAGDLIAEDFKVGYLPSLFLFAALIAAVTLAYYTFKLNAVAAFWLAYILTRPLGASIGDYLTQSPRSGGLGVGTTITNALFFAAILGIVAYLTVTRIDELPAAESHR